MLESSRHRATNRRAALLASITILCLVIAPACAPLCAAKLCASSGHNECHGMTPEDSARSLLSAKTACRGFDPFAVLPRVDEQLFASTSNGTTSSALGVKLSGAVFDSVAGASENETTLHNPLRPPGALLETTVLRV